MNNSCLVYKLTSPNGKVYLGITSRDPQKRWKNGKGYSVGTYIRKAIDKYGWDSFSHEILEENVTWEKACELEKHYIGIYDAMNPSCGYNLKDGGQDGYVYTDEVKMKISVSLKEFYANHPGESEKISKRMLGRKKSKAERDKMSRSKIGKHPKRTEEHNAKISAALSKRYREDTELRNRQSDRIVSYSMAKKKAVVQLLDDGSFVALYESGKSAMRSTGISDRNIVRCCNGGAKHAGGYRWQYAINYNSGRETAI